MGIPLLAHPKHTYPKIGGLTDSDSEYSYDSEDELDNLIQYSKEIEFNSTKNSKSNQNSLPNLVIYATPEGRTVCLDEPGLKNQFVEASSPKVDEVPFQEGASIDPLGSKQDQEVENLYREILMVRIFELHESDDDSMERLNLDDYNSDDYDEYLSDNMEAIPMTITEVKTTIKQEPPLAPPAVTVTVQLEDEPVAKDLYKRHSVLNQKRAFRH
jgi:hypothetical protein